MTRNQISEQEFKKSRVAKLAYLHYIRTEEDQIRINPSGKYHIRNKVSENDPMTKSNSLGPQLRLAVIFKKNFIHLQS